MIISINEGKTHWLTASFKDKNGVDAIPTSAQYRIDCLTTGAAVRALTVLTPAASIEIKLTPDDVSIEDVANTNEIKRVTLLAIYGDDSDQIPEQYDYRVINMSYIPT